MNESFLNSRRGNSDFLVTLRGTNPLEKYLAVSRHFIFKKYIDRKK